MSHSIHSNRLSVMLDERNVHNNEAEPKNICCALKFLEGVDHEDEALRLRRRRRAQRAAGSIAGFAAARALFVR